MSIVGTTLKILLTIKLVLTGLIPDFLKNALQGVHLLTFNAAVHIVPFTHHLGAIDVIVGHIHTACIGYHSIDDDDFSVVAAEDMVDPWKTDRVKLINLYSHTSDFPQVFFPEWLVVGVIAEPVKQCTHFHSFLHFLTK